MAKRKLPTDQLRHVIRARMTKGEAFSSTHHDYQARQTDIAAMLHTMTRDELFAKYPEYLYDMKR